MAWDKGFNFRQTSGYVTDGTNCTYVLPSDTYPVTRNSVTFGWTVAPSDGRDRDAGLDPKLAGICFGNGNGTFRVDLPNTGSFAISVAMGDASAGQTGSQVLIKDNTTTKITVGPHDTASGEFFDATDISRSSVSWPGSNVSSTQTFGTTTLFLTLEAAGSNSVIAHLFISEVSGGGGGGTGQPSSKRSGGVPYMRLGGPSFGSGWM